MTRLEELAKKYGTDKLEHGYIPYYDKYLPKNIFSIFEFGCYKGASIRMWNDFFCPSELGTFDLFDEFDVSKELSELGIKTFKGDTNYIEDLLKIWPNSWDLIIEDASHNSHDQQFIFLFSFISLLNSGGAYIVEDLHCCNDSFYWNRGIDKFEDTFLWVLQNWTPENGFPINKYFNGYYKLIIDSMVKDVKLHDNKIAFIFKK